jgi:hypothetical protein
VTTISDVDPSIAREALRIERGRLDRESIRLRHRGHLIDSADQSALHLYAAQLHNHTVQLSAFSLALHAFHMRFGPLGP